MANVKWTEFPAASTISGSDLIPIVQSGTNKKATGTIFATYIGTLFVSLSAEQTIAGVKTFSSQLASSVATGTAPFSIASTTKVTNLNADLLDGYTSADFQLALTNPITGTGTTNYLPKFTGTSALGNSLIYDNGTNVGINTTSPLTQLTLNGDLSLFTAKQIRLYNSAKNNWAELSSPLINGDSEIDLKIVTKSGIFYFNPTGSLGLGTTNPTEKLHIKGSGINTQTISLESTISASNSYVILGSTSKSYITGLSTDFSNSYIIYDATASALRLAVSTAGNVLIGTTTDSGYKLDVNGTARVGAEMTITNSNSGLYSVLALTNTGTSGRSYQIGLGGNTSGLNGVFYVYDATAGATRFSIAPSGAATFSSSVTTGGQVTIEANAGTIAGGRNSLYLKNTNASGNQSNIIVLGSAGASSSWAILNDINADGTTINRLDFLNNGNVRFSLTADGGSYFSGAALFNSSVTTGGQILVNTGTANQNTKIFGDKVGMSRTSDGAEVVYFSKNTDLGTEGTANINGYNGIQFRTQGAESVKVTIKENGNLLVNKTTDVGYKLDVFGTTRLDPQNGEYGLVVGRASGMVNIKAGSDDGGYLLMDSAGEGGMVGLNWYSSENVILANGGGKVGIGNSSPIHKLSVDGKIGGTIFGDSYIEFTSIGHTIIKANNDVFLGYSQDCIVTQSGQLAVGTTTPDASAKVQIDSTTQGFLVPRMSEGEIISISSPAAGLLVYNTDQNHMCMYDGSVWKKFSMSNM